MTIDAIAMLAEIQAELDDLTRRIAHLAPLERAVIAFLDTPEPAVSVPEPEIPGVDGAGLAQHGLAGGGAEPAAVSPPAPAPAPPLVKLDPASRARVVGSVAGKKPAVKAGPKKATPANIAAAQARRTRPPDTEVLAVIATAKAEGRPMKQAVATHFAVPPTTANNWITQARKTTTTAPAPAPAPPAVEKVPAAPAATSQARPGTMVLVCNECEFEVSTAQISALMNHTVKVHGRRISDSERRPVPAGQVAS